MVPKAQDDKANVLGKAEACLCLTQGWLSGTESKASQVMEWCHHSHAKEGKNSIVFPSRPAWAAECKTLAQNINNHHGM